MATFRQRLREIRTNNNLTQKQFAQMFKVSESAIGIYERDEREPPYKLSNEVDDHYEVTTDYLHGHTDNPNPIKQGKIDEKEQAQFKAFINDPEYGIFFKDYVSAPEERREEMRKIWSILREKEKDRKPGDRQGDTK